MTTISSVQASDQVGAITNTQTTRPQDNVQALVQSFATALLESIGSTTRIEGQPTTSNAKASMDAANGAARLSTDVTADQSSAISSWRAPWLAGAENANSYLHTADADAVTRQTGKPDAATFMKATGADFATASSLLYGVMGSNEDFRNWNAIMAAPDPIMAARQATGALYQSDLPYASEYGGGFTPDSQQVLAQSGPFAWLRIEQREGLWLLDGRGQILRPIAFSAPDILRTSRDFGIDVGKLTDLADQMDTLGVHYQPGQQHPGSDHGVDLRDLAAGGVGSAYNWTIDPQAHLKAPGAQDAEAANARLAQELGLVLPRGTSAAASIKTSNVGDTKSLAEDYLNQGAAKGVPAGETALIEQLLSQLKVALTNSK